MLVLLGSLETTVFRGPGRMRDILIIKNFPAEIVTTRARDSVPLKKDAKGSRSES